MGGTCVFSLFYCIGSYNSVDFVWSNCCQLMEKCQLHVDMETEPSKYNYKYLLVSGSNEMLSTAKSKQDIKADTV